MVFLRYMDPQNEVEFAAGKLVTTGDKLIFTLAAQNMLLGIYCTAAWTKFLFDLGYIGHDEPYKKLVNQGNDTGQQQVCV